MIHDLPEAQKICSCGCSLTQIGSDKSEQIEYIPANIVVIEHIRYKYACKECEETVRRAEVPHKPLLKSNATASLLAYTIISKFADHLPLYRQSKIWERFETYIPRATLSNWIIACSVKLSPLVSLLKEDLVKHDYICSDETPIRVLSQKNKAYMWVHISGIREHRVVIYDYQNNRSGDTGLKILENFSGYHQCDAYSGYNNFHLRDWIIYVGCWAHVRRKFYEIVKISKKEGVASSILKKIGKLYDLERWADQYNFSPEKRKELRLEKAVAILASIKEELDYYENLALPKGLLGRAIGYCLNNWDSLNTYLLDGKIRIDNNDCEGVIRLIALGRKNWLFCYTDNGARATSIMYSIIQTAVVNHLDLYPYLQYTIENIREGMEEAELREFLPYNFNKDNFLKAA
jgi:transposase